MPNLVRYIEAGEIRPALAATYPLEELHAAQAAFIEKAAHWQHRGDPMKITRITVYQVDLPLEHPYWLSAGG
jgi:hypothetical protein